MQRKVKSREDKGKSQTRRPRRATGHGPWRRLGQVFRRLGPGLTTGAADDDPSGVATYSQAGSQFGYQPLWISLVTFPLMAVVQEMCARIGMATGRGLASNIRIHYPRTVLYLCALLLFLANTFNIGADLGMMARSVQLLAPSLPFPALVVMFSVASLLLQVFLPYAQYAKYLKWLTLALFTYVVTAFTVHGINWADVLHSTVVPTLVFSKDSILLVCGILGTTISPYLFFWQTSQEVEEEIEQGATSVAERQNDVTPETITNMRADVWLGMFFSNVVMFFIILTASAVLHAAGKTDINSAAEAAEALRPLAGQAAFLLFAIGIIGVGLLAVPVLAGSAAYAIAESFRWKAGLYKKLHQAWGFYGVIAASMLVGLFINFIGINQIHALIYSAIANGFVAPIVLYFVISLSSRQAVMGSFANNRLTSAIGWITTVAMAITAIASIILLIV